MVDAGPPVAVMSVINILSGGGGGGINKRVFHLMRAAVIIACSFESRAIILYKQALC